MTTIAQLRSFAEAATGGRVLAAERAALGSSRLTLLVDAEDAQGRPLSLVVRHDSGDGPLSGTQIDLAHEAVFYRALGDQPVRIPRLLAESPDGRTLLIERARGTDAFAALEPGQRKAVAADYAAALAELHRVETGGLSLPGVAVPDGGAEHALLDLHRWRAIQNARVPEPAPITQLAGDWLAHHPPTHVERTVLCHGDAGPGNFLFDGERVTAMLDWEFAHLGDALDDVAWVLVRSHLVGGEPEMLGALPEWSRRAGIPLDAARIVYYRALVLLRMAISCQVALGHADGGQAMNTAVYEMLLPYLCHLLPQALAEAGCDDPRLGALARDGRAGVEAIAVLRDHAKPLTPWQTP